MKNLNYQKPLLYIVSIALFLVLASCASGRARSLAAQETQGDDADPFLSLEDISSESSLAWAKQHNEKSLGELMAQPQYAPTEEALRKILTAKDRIPYPNISNGDYYNFWQDQEHPKGLWRKTSAEQYRRETPEWETILDVDLLSKTEGQSWVLKEMGCWVPTQERCLMKLSKGGKDAVVIREFDTVRKTFVSEAEKGFQILKDAKLDIAWLDLDTVLIASDFGEGSLTEAGYPRIVKLWKRGTPLSSAQVLFEGKVKDTHALPFTLFLPSGNRYFVERKPSFFESELYELNPKTLELSKIDVPLDAQIMGGYKSLLLFKLRTNWKTFEAGSLIAWHAGAAELLYKPGPKEAFSGIAITRNGIYLELLDDVNGVLKQLSDSGKGWKVTPIKVPAHSAVSVTDSDTFTDEVIVNVEGFLTPATLFSLNSPKGRLGNLVKLKSAPTRFDSKGMVAEQIFAQSKDGTKIPYFLIRKKGKKAHAMPTLLYGYGGFEVSMLPRYMGGTGKVWLEKGGAYVLANIRGGGEYGPAWHQAALLKNRQKAYDDFIAVAEDLISKKITDSQHLGIMGGSNGGLLMGVMLTQRPELFAASVVQVPLLDMLRYHKLLAGASWVGEYGSVEDPETAPALRAYSPYQNLRVGLNISKPFVLTSTKDDRVHPGHARKFVAKLEKLGYPVFYFENIEGGHGAAADLEQRIKRNALEFTYLMRQLNLP